MAKKYSWSDALDLRNMASTLQSGGVLVGSSDTVFGFLALVSHEGKARLDHIKGRQDKPYLVLAASIEEVSSLVDALQMLQVEKLLHSFWPGPLTIIFKAHRDAPACLQSKSGTVAVRVPKHEGLQKLLAQTGPLFSTSANKTGQPVPQTFQEMDQDILAAVDGIVLDNESVSMLPEPSTLLDVTGEQPVILREGAIKKSELEKVLGTTL